MKVFKKILIILLVLVIVLISSLLFMFRKEIQTILSIKQIDEYGLYEAHFAHDYALDELIANGGASTDAELTNFLIDKILKGLPIEFNIPDFGCSTFLAENDSNQYLFGRNYDLDPVPSMVMFTSPEEGYKSISIANANVIGIEVNQESLSIMQKAMALAAPYVMMDGMNEKGLAIAVLLIKDEATNQDTDKPDLTTTSMMRLVLDKAQNVEEAIALFEAYDMHASANSAYHFQIVDKEGNSAVIEYVENEINVIRKEEGENQFLTNFMISEEVYGFGHGHDRFEILEETLNTENGQLNEDEALALLESVKQDTTQWSVVYNLETLSLDVTVHGDFDTIYSYSFNDFK